jgi:hypothetical protein
MATRQQIARLSQRIEALADQHSKPWRIGPTLIIQPGETQEAAWAQHLVDHPEDRGKSPGIVIQVIATIDGRPDPAFHR